MPNSFVKSCFVLILEERHWELKWTLFYSDVSAMCDHANLVFLTNHDAMTSSLNSCKFRFTLRLGGV